jgi:pre-60S factor REI1
MLMSRGLLTVSYRSGCCFFFDAKSADGSTEGCVKHMHKVHGFFIPDSQCLTYPYGMPSYLGLKVSQSS